MVRTCPNFVHFLWLKKRQGDIQTKMRLLVCSRRWQAAPPASHRAALVTHTTPRTRLRRCWMTHQSPLRAGRWPVKVLTEPHDDQSRSSQSPSMTRQSPHRAGRCRASALAPDRSSPTSASTRASSSRSNTSRRTTCKSPAKFSWNSTRSTLLFTAGGVLLDASYGQFQQHGRRYTIIDFCEVPVSARVLRHKLDLCRITLRYDTIRYNTVYVSALNCGRDGQLGSLIKRTAQKRKK